jgi:hypothetical protein
VWNGLWSSRNGLLLSTDDFTTNHNGFLAFYLCDVSDTADKDISDDPAFWKSKCHELERVPRASCEAGTDMECGPIHPKFPGRFVVPCRNSKGGDQVIGGPNGKMAYRIPDVEMEHAVIQSYWMTANNCNPPDGFTETYKFPAAWAGCPGDGGSVGGKCPGKSCAVTGGTPEEFLNCADVRIVRKGGSASKTESLVTRNKTKVTKTHATTTPTRVAAHTTKAKPSSFYASTHTAASASRSSAKLKSLPTTTTSTTQTPRRTSTAMKTYATAPAAESPSSPPRTYASAAKPAKASSSPTAGGSPSYA